MLRVVAGTLVLAGLLCAQGFEVAAIHVNRDPSADANLDSLPGGRLVVTSQTLRELLRFAFDLKDFQLIGVPGWADNERYDIDAKEPADKKENLRGLMRILLEDRFALKHHSETREMTIYSLKPAKDGVKLTRHDEGTGTTARTTCGHITGKRVTADVIAKMLSRYLGRDVHDDTGLPGKYDFELAWTPETGPCGDAPEGPSIFTAVQQQLGLRLDSTKGQVPVVVVERVEKPSEN